MLRRPVVGAGVLAGLIALGFAALWAVAGSWLAEAAWGNPVPSAGEQIAFAEGRPVVGRYVYPPGEWQYHELDGRPLGKGRTGLGTPAPLAARLPDRLPVTQRGWGQRLRRFDLGGRPAEVWYLVTDGRPGGSAWFAGYDAQTRAPLGVLGTAGLRPGPAAAGPPEGERVPFAGLVEGPNARVFSAGYGLFGELTGEMVPQVRWSAEGIGSGEVYLLGRDGRLYRADLPARTVAALPGGADARSAWPVYHAVGAGREEVGVTLAVRTADAVRVLGRGGRELARYPIPEALREGDFSFLQGRPGEAVMVGYHHRPGNAETVCRVFHVRPDGAAREQEVRLARDPAVVREPLWQAGGLLLPAPALYAPLLLTRVLEGNNGAVTGPGVRRVLAESWLPLGTALAVALVLAGLCYRRQVRYGAAGVARWAWPVFVLLLGLPGWVGYRFATRWPPREPCPACAADAPRDRDACARCGAEFPGPALKGTEVFA